MKRDRRIAYLGALVAAAAAVLVAGLAGASEGELVIVPHDAQGHFAVRELLILIVFFSALVYPLNALLFKPIFRVLDEREEKTAGTRRHAERIAANAEEVLERYESAIRAARQEAEAERKQTLEGARADGGSVTAGARGEAERTVAHARAEMATALEQAGVQLRAQSESLAREVAERALGRSLS